MFIKASNWIFAWVVGSSSAAVSSTGMPGKAS